MMVSKLLSFTLFALLHQSAFAAKSIAQLDTIVIQLRSESDSDNSGLLNEVLQVTKRFVSDYFGSYYKNNEPAGYFVEARVDANSFGIQGGDGSYINTIQFEGELVFDSDSTPQAPFLRNLLTNAFKGLNLDLYLENLLSSDDPFLSQLTQAFIEIDGKPVTDTSLGQPTTTTLNASTEESGLQLQEWASVLIYVTAGIVGVVVVIGIFCLCRGCGSKGQVRDEGEAITLKKIEIPSLAFDESKSQSRSFKSISFIGGRNIAPGRERSLSPSRSIMSHDSSLFTYNPAMSTRDAGTLSLGSISHFNIGAPKFDLEAWQQKNVISSVTPAPFGHDISAIEHKDHLSILEDGDAMALRPRGAQRTTRNSGRRFAHIPYTTSTIREASGRENSLEASTSSSSDVINDLKNLSLQIDRHRGSRGGTSHQR